MSINSKYSKTFLVALCSLVYFVSYFSRKNFAAVVAGMIESSVIDKVTAGFVGMGLFIAYGVGQLISGYLGDKIKPKYLILAGLGTTALCNALMPLVGRAGLMIAVWSVNGFAQAMLWPPIVRILADNLTHERFVRANLAVTTAAHVATVLLYLYVPVCIKFFSWETVFATATVMAVIAMLVFIISISLIIPSKSEREEQASAPEKEEVKSESDSCYVKLLAKSGIFYIFFSIIMMGFLRDGIESWLPTLYSEAFSRDAAESILISVALPIFATLSITLITTLHKTPLFKNEARGAVILFAVAMLLCIPICVLIGTESAVLRVVCLVLSASVCAAMHGCNFLFISCIPGRFSVYGKAATTSGFCNAFTYIGAAVSTYGMAIISELFSWRVTVGAWIAVAGLGAMLTLASYKRYTEFIRDLEVEK